MASIAQYQQNIQRYQTLRAKVGAIAARLHDAANHVDGVDAHVKNGYRINGGDAVIAGRTTGLKNDLRGTANHLNGAVIPAIDAAINNAQQQIRRLEEEERRRQEEERRRQEEERKRQEEEEERRRQEEEANRG